MRRPRWMARPTEVLEEHVAPPPGERKYVGRADARKTTRRVLRQEQQDEMAESWLGLGLLTDAQFKGALIGGLLGALLGVVLVLPLGFIAFGGFSIWVRMGIVALCGALAGAVGFAHYFGGRAPELEGETMDIDVDD